MRNLVMRSNAEIAPRSGPGGIVETHCRPILRRYTRDFTPRRKRNLPRWRIDEGPPSRQHLGHRILVTRARASRFRRFRRCRDPRCRQRGGGHDGAKQRQSFAHALYPFSRSHVPLRAFCRAGEETAVGEPQPCEYQHRCAERGDAGYQLASSAEHVAGVEEARKPADAPSKR